MADGSDPVVPTEVKALFNDIQKSFLALREKNDELSKQLKKGSEDAVTKAEFKTVNDAVDKMKDEFNALWKKANRPAVAASPDAQKAQAIERKHNREFRDWFLERGVSAPFDEGGAGNLRKDYAAAFDKMVRRGEKALTPDETKTLSVGSAPDGGFYVEPARADRIIEKLFETSEMRAIASTITISTSSIKYPLDRDEAGFEWVGEQSTRNQTATPQVGELEIPVHELSAMPAATQNILDDSAVDMEAWLSGKIADKFARGENSAFVTGSGTNKPKGILAYPVANTGDAAGTRAFGTLEYVKSGAAAGFVAPGAGVLPSDCLLKLIYAFKSGYRTGLRWAMNRTTLGTVRQFKDGQGNYVAGVQLTVAGLIDQIFSLPVSEFADMPDVGANAFPIALGNWSRGYQIVDRQGIRQLRDPYTSKPLTLFYTTKRVGGAVVDSDAIKLLKNEV